EPRIVLAKRATTAPGTANLPLWQRLCIEITLAAIDRRTGEPGDFRDNRETTSTSSPHLGRRKQSPRPLIELRANRVPSQPNGGLVDHATDLPRFAENRNPQHLSQSDARAADDDSVIVRSVLSISIANLPLLAKFKQPMLIVGSCRPCFTVSGSVARPCGHLGSVCFNLRATSII